MQKKIWLTGVIAGFMANPLLADVFSQNDHCVAWKTEKVMFLFKKTEPVGKNCEITTEFQSTDSDTPEHSYQLTMSVPLDKFDSGDAQRDKDVVELLRGDVRSELLLETDLMDQQSWRQFWAGESMEMPITVWIGEESYRLVIKPEVDGEQIKGAIQTKFLHFNLESPKVAMGVVANVSEDLELHFQIQKDQVKNNDWLKTQDQKI